MYWLLHRVVRCGRGRLLLILKYYPNIHLEESDENSEDPLVRITGLEARKSILDPPECETGVPASLSRLIAGQNRRIEDGPGQPHTA